MEEIVQNNIYFYQIINSCKTFYNIDGFFLLDNKKILYDNDNIYIDIIIIKLNNNKYWLSSIVMILYLESLNIENKNILELGSGNGIVSIYLSKKYKKINITSSDMFLNNLENIINYNDINNINIKKILWNDLDNNDKDKYDIIIASDCIYGNNYEYLFETIKKYLNNNGKIIICNPYREKLDNFIYKIQEIYEDINIKIKRLIINNLYYINIYIIDNM